jgi:hypothetical protein
VYVLLAPPIFFFAPLALLLLGGWPRSAREWFWLVASAVLAVLWAVSGTAALAPGVTAAAGVIGAGLFLALSLGTGWSVFHRALTATLVGVGTVAGWASLLGQSWAGVQLSFANGLRTVFAAQAEAFAARGTDPAVVDQLRAMGESTAKLAPFFSAFLVLAGLAGLALAAQWHAQLSGRALGRRSAPFRTFRFSDQALWLLVAGMAAMLLRSGSPSVLGVPLRAWAANLALVMGVLYVLRGLAVYRTAAVRVPRRVNVVLGVVSVLFWPIAGTGLALLGLADSWVDFRRRFGVPQPEDGTDDGSNSAG